MKKFLVGSLVSVLLSSAAGVAFAASPAVETAHVTLTVSKFRPMATQGEPIYVDAQMTLAPHAAVTQVERAGIPTLVVKRAVNIEITLDSRDAAESYRPLGIIFKEQGPGTGNPPDADGKINFAQSRPNESTVVIHNKFIQKGSYEFFVVVQSVGTGEIGIIDPDIENENAG